MDLISIIIVALLVSLTPVLVITYLQKWLHARRKQLSNDSAVLNIGIFHPYCSSGGGGERVLWCAVRSLQAKYQNIKIIVYTGDTEDSLKNILGKVRNVFNINIHEESIVFVHLRSRYLVEPKNYPVLTLLGQSIGSMLLGLEALCKHPPDIFIETTGYTFVLPIFRYIGRCAVGCYVHYPIISTEMLRRVHQREYSHSNKIYIVRNPFLTWLKFNYYNIFAKLYGLVGRCSDTIMVNSSWTEQHILTLFKVPFKTHIVFPPCSIDPIMDSVHRDENDEFVILSVGQFRPEKDHPLQLQVMYELRTILANNEDLWNKIKLVIVGSCRHKDDYDRLKNIQDLCKHLSLENSVEFKVNLSFDELLQEYARAKIGIHTMWNEHFGISVVECMAAGIIMVAHKSGGPLMDIIQTADGSRNGYLATNPTEYADCILSIILNPKETNDVIRAAARSSSKRFSEKEFENNFLRAVSILFETKRL